jgi:hypothetical protein
MSMGSLLRWAIALILAGAVVALPFAISSGGPALMVRLGHGQDGYFTANAHACETACYWVGDYRARNGSLALTEMVMAPGASIAHAGERVRAVYAHEGALVYPPGGGTAWIPLACVLIVIAVCLPLVAVWILRWRRRRRIRPDGQHLPVAVLGDTAATPPGGRRIGASGIGLALGVVITILVFGGAAVATTGREVPSAPAPAAAACADYTAWALAQSDNGPPGRDPARLAQAEQQAPPAGQLAADLDTLGRDVTTATEASETDAGLIAQMAVVHDMQSVSHDCS